MINYSYVLTSLTASISAFEANNSLTAWACPICEAIQRGVAWSYWVKNRDMV